MSKKLTKVLAIVLSVLMAFSAVSVAAFAASDGTDDSARVAGWKSDYSLLLNEVTDNYNWANWKYVAENNSEISKQMITYTVFSLYDSAWRNAFDKSVSVENAEAVLASLLEQYQGKFFDDNGTLDKIMEVLKGAKSAADLVTKVNDFFKGDNFLNSSEWSDAMGVLGKVISVGNYTQDELAKLEVLYARIITVKMASANYSVMLQYIVDNCTYSVDVTAAKNLLADIALSDKEVYAELAKVAAGDVTETAATTAIEAAINSNQYTAIAEKVYKAAGKVADELFNTGSVSTLTDTLYSTFYFETTVNDWAKACLDGTDASLATFAVAMDLSMRDSGNTALVNLKIAQHDGGWVNKVLGKLETKVADLYYTDGTKIAMFKDLLFADVSTFKKADAVVTVFCPVSVKIGGYTLADTADASYLGNEGYYKTVANTYTGELLKVVIPFALTADDDSLVLTADAAGSVEMIAHVLKDGKVGEYAFSAAQTVAAGDVITVDHLATFTTTLPTANLNGAAVDMANQYTAPKTTTPSASDVADAVKSVGKDAFSQLIAQIKAMFQQFLDAFKNIFANFKIGK